MPEKMQAKQVLEESMVAHIDSLTPEGRGVAHIDGKTVFVSGALPGEEVQFRYIRRHSNFDEAYAVAVIKTAPNRVFPRCKHFNLCGGCTLQHLDANAQIHAKQQGLLDNLKRIGNVVPMNVLSPLTASNWGYRRKARLGVRYVHKKQRVLVGFREKSSHYLADLEQCEILHPHIGLNLRVLADFIQGLDAYNKIPQVEIAAGDNGTALVFRHLEELSENDRQRFQKFAKQHNYYIYLQAKGPDTAMAVWPEDAALFYTLPEHGIQIDFKPIDFTQINYEINAMMINRTMELLRPEPDDHVLDLFCGIGNLSLPIARKVSKIVGVEGEVAQVNRARQNALRNKIYNADFHVADLKQDINVFPWMRKQYYDKIVLDPPRSGALEILASLSAIAAGRIVYVSCNPTTLSHDAGELVHKHGYQLESLAVIDMFPHTSHVESMALFVRG